MNFHDYSWFFFYIKTCTKFDQETKKYFWKFFGLRQNLTGQYQAQIKKGTSRIRMCYKVWYYLNCDTKIVLIWACNCPVKIWRSPKNFKNKFSFTLHKSLQKSRLGDTQKKFFWNFLDFVKIWRSNCRHKSKNARPDFGYVKWFGII